MTEIDVPDWVVEAACAKLAVGMEFEGKWPEDYQDEAGDELREAMRAALTAALGAWVVPAGYMDAKAEFMLPRPGRCVLSSHTVLVRDAYEGRNLPLYTLRQEKPE